MNSSTHGNWTAQHRSTYIVLIHHVGMGPLTSHSTKLCKSYHGSVPTSWQSGNSRVHNDQIRKGIGVSFRESQQPLFACSFMARAALREKITLFWGVIESCLKRVPITPLATLHHSPPKLSTIPYITPPNILPTILHYSPWSAIFIPKLSLKLSIILSKNLSNILYNSRRNLFLEFPLQLSPKHIPLTLNEALTLSLELSQEGTPFNFTLQ